MFTLLVELLITVFLWKQKHSNQHSRNEEKTSKDKDKDKGKAQEMIHLMIIKNHS